MNNFTELSKKSIAEWNTLVNSDEVVIYLGMGSCGKAAGADKVKEVILKTLIQNELSPFIFCIISEMFCLPPKDIRA